MAATEPSRRGPPSHAVNVNGGGAGSFQMPAKYDELNPQALRRMVGAGTQLRPFPRQVLEAAEKAAYELYEELKGKSKHWASVYPKWKAFRDEQFLWFRVAEHTYDSYAFNSKIGMAAPAAKK